MSRKLVRKALFASCAAVAIVGFGSNMAHADDLGLGVDGTISQEFKGETHDGTDIAAPAGSTVRAVTAGTVVNASEGNDAGSGGYKTYVEVVGNNGEHTVMAQYGHVTDLKVKPGDTVVPGQEIATVMPYDPAYETGEHLHLRIHVDGQPVDPEVAVANYESHAPAPAQPEAEAPAPAPAPEPEPAPMVEQTTVIQTGQHDWSGVLQCESSGNWGINSGNGYYGGLQFSPTTWEAYGGTGSAADASPEEQIRVAENVLAAQGPQAWPVCSQYLTGGTTSVETTTMVPSETAPAPQAEAIPAPGPQLPEAQIIPDVLPTDQDQALQTYVDNGVQQAEAWANGTGNPVVENFVDNATTAITNAVDTFTGGSNAPAFEPVVPQAVAIPQWTAPEPAPMPVQTVDMSQVVDDTADFAKTVAPQAAPMIDNFAAQANAFFGQFMVGAPAAP